MSSASRDTRSKTQRRGSSSSQPITELSEALEEIERLRNANDDLQKINDDLRAKFSDLQSTVNTVSEGHMAQADHNAKQDRVTARMAAQFDEMAKQIEKLQQSVLRTNVPDRAGPSSSVFAHTARPAPSQAQGQQPNRRSSQQQQQLQQPQLLQPQLQKQHAEIHEFVIYAKQGNTPNTVLEVISEKLGFNTGVFSSVQKIAAAPSPAAAAVAPDAAEGEAARSPNDVYVFRTTNKFVADQAVKGNLRKRLRESDIPMYVDDYLTKEERLQRKARLHEKMELKANGVKVAWRRAALWKMVSDGHTDTWEVVVPAPVGVAATAPTQP
jgi:hypothetical protein